MNTANSKITLDDVLNDIASLPAPPDRKTFRWIVDQHPAYREEIIDFVTDWIAMEAVLPQHETTQEDVNRVVNRAMSQVQRILRQSEESAPIQDLAVAVHEAGRDLRSFERSVGIDRTLFTSLADRRIRPQTIPRRLLTAIARSLCTPVGAVRRYLCLPPRHAAAYSAITAPKLDQVDFEVAVLGSALSDKERRLWLAEPPDPTMGI